MVQYEGESHTLSRTQLSTREGSKKGKCFHERMSSYQIEANSSLMT